MHGLVIGVLWRRQTGTRTGRPEYVDLGDCESQSHVCTDDCMTTLSFTFKYTDTPSFALYRQYKSALTMAKQSSNYFCYICICIVFGELE